MVKYLKTPESYLYDVNNGVFIYNGKRIKENVLAKKLRKQHFTEKEIDNIIFEAPSTNRGIQIYTYN